MRDVSFLTELYWFTCVVDLGSYSAAAEQAGVAKSSLSRRGVQLEERLGVQLLSRSTRKVTMTSAGEDVYRHALDMLGSAQAAQLSALETLGAPTGLVRIAIPGVLSEWLIGLLSVFQRDYPSVRYELCLEEDIANTAKYIDLHLSLRPPPNDSAEVVVHPLAVLPRVMVASPSLGMGSNPLTSLKALPDTQLLAYGTHLNIQPWALQDSLRTLKTPVFISSNLQTLKQAACAGLGVAYLPLIACQAEIANKTLQVVCISDLTLPIELNILMPSFCGITLTARRLIDAIRENIVSL